MIKGKLYKSKGVDYPFILFCTRTDTTTEHFEGFIIKSDNYGSIGYHSIAWAKGDFEEYIGQLDLNNVYITE